MGIAALLDDLAGRVGDGTVHDVFVGILHPLEGAFARAVDGLLRAGLCSVVHHAGMQQVAFGIRTEASVMVLTGGVRHEDGRLASTDERPALRQSGKDR